jgi:hypothetical protein
VSRRGRRRSTWAGTLDANVKARDEGKELGLKERTLVGASPECRRKRCRWGDAKEKETDNGERAFLTRLGAKNYLLVARKYPGRLTVRLGW